MFIKQADNSYSHPWRWILGFIVIFLGCQFLGAMPFMIAVILEELTNGGDIVSLLNADESYFMNVMSKNKTFFFLLLSFFIGTIVWWLWVKYVHRLSTREVTTSRPNFDWKRAGLAFFIVGVMSVLSTYASYELFPGEFQWNYKPDVFWILVVISVMMVPIQTTWEELFFRSYMMQGLGVISRTRWVPFVLTSTIFGLVHIFNPEIAKLGYVIMFWYIGTGFLLGIFTLMDQGIELAVGFHAANNLFIAILVTSDWTAFQTDSLLLDISDPQVGIATFVPLLVYYPLLVAFFAWKYKWTNWRERLLGDIDN